MNWLNWLKWFNFWRFCVLPGSKDVNNHQITFPGKLTFACYLCVLQRHFNYDQAISGAEKKVKEVNYPIKAKMFDKWCITCKWLYMYNYISGVGMICCHEVILPGGSRRWNSASWGEGKRSIHTVWGVWFFIGWWRVFLWQGAFWLKWLVGLGRY